MTLTQPLTGLEAFPMSILDGFFVTGVASDPMLWREHDPWVVALSAALATLFAPLLPQMLDICARRAD